MDGLISLAKTIPTEFSNKFKKLMGFPKQIGITCHVINATVYK